MSSKKSHARLALRNMVTGGENLEKRYMFAVNAVAAVTSSVQPEDESQTPAEFRAASYVVSPGDTNYARTLSKALQNGIKAYRQQADKVVDGLDDIATDIAYVRDDYYKALNVDKMLARTFPKLGARGSLKGIEEQLNDIGATDIVFGAPNDDVMLTFSQSFDRSRRDDVALRGSNGSDYLNGTELVGKASGSVHLTGTREFVLTKSQGLLIRAANSEFTIGIGVHGDAKGLAQIRILNDVHDRAEFDITGQTTVAPLDLNGDRFLSQSEWGNQFTESFSGNVSVLHSLTDKLAGVEGAFRWKNGELYTYEDGKLVKHTEQLILPSYTEFMGEAREGLADSVVNMALPTPVDRGLSKKIDFIGSTDRITDGIGNRILPGIKQGLQTEEAVRGDLIVRAYATGLRVDVLPFNINTGLKKLSWHKEFPIVNYSVLGVVNLSASAFIDANMSYSAIVSGTISSDGGLYLNNNSTLDVTASLEGGIVGRAAVTLIEVGSVSGSLGVEAKLHLRIDAPNGSVSFTELKEHSREYLSGKLDVDVIARLKVKVLGFSVVDKTWKLLNVVHLVFVQPKTQIAAIPSAHLTTTEVLIFRDDNEESQQDDSDAEWVDEILVPIE